MILCLNVTKWVQLNFGDDGLKWMFKKIYLQLLPGGRLLLEPQSYNTYKKKKNLTVCFFIVFSLYHSQADQETSETCPNIQDEIIQKDQNILRICSS